MMKFQSSFLILITFIFCACGSSNEPAPRKDSPSTAPNPTSEAQVASDNKKRIIFFGISLTAGFGVSQDEAFPAIVQEKIDSLQLAYTVVNAGLSGETSSGGLARIDWILKQPIDIFVLELGANDGLRGIPLNLTFQNLQKIIDRVRGKYPKSRIVLAGMQIPPNMGPQYTSQFKSLFQDLAKRNKLTLIPFLLEGVGGNDQFNQGDGMHPNAQGHRIVANNVWAVLRAIL